MAQVNRTFLTMKSSFQSFSWTHLGRGMFDLPTLWRCRNHCQDLLVNHYDALVASRSCETSSGEVRFQETSGAMLLLGPGTRFGVQTCSARRLPRSRANDSKPWAPRQIESRNDRYFYLVARQVEQYLLSANQ